jgi:hypothetical protein
MSLLGQAQECGRVTQCNSDKPPGVKLKFLNKTTSQIIVRFASTQKRLHTFTMMISNLMWTVQNQAQLNICS